MQRVIGQCNGSQLESATNKSRRTRTEHWLALILCAAVVLSRAIEHLLASRLALGPSLSPDWLPLAAGALAAAGILRRNGPPRWLRLRRSLHWTSLLLMVWVANGLPFDLLTMAGLIGDPATGGRASVDWQGLATRTLALAAALMLAHLALAPPDTAASGLAARPPANWYGYAAFALALPYPVLRMHWAFGGTLGLGRPGAAGQGFAPLLIAIPWVLAAVVSLLLVSPRHWIPRRLLLAAGWSATAIVAMIGPAACWVLITRLVSGGARIEGMAIWVPCLFYGSWFLWSVAAAAATRSYQLRSAAMPTSRYTHV